MTTHSSPTAIDLFCGCGGLAAGARDAGFDVLAGVDSEPKYMSTFTKNFGMSASIGADLSELEPEVLAARLKLKREQLGLLVGGPPCQGFSKNVPRRSRFMEDQRNLLVLRFLRFAEWFRPRLILMENVAEMKSGFDQAYSEEIVEVLTKSGYAVTHAVLNAADFGVPQRRRRAFFVGIRDGIEVQLPSPTHRAPGASIDLFGSPNHVSVWDAIGDLPPLQHGEGIERLRYPIPPKSAYQRWVRSSNGEVRNHVSRTLQPLQFQRLAALKPGQGLKDLPPELRTKGGYSGAYGRLTKDMIAPTITRWVFHPGSGRWGHPVDTRTLSIREIARIQGFHDDYVFDGTFLRQAGQLGNAVPPLLASKVLEFVGLQAGLLSVQKTNEVLHRKAINE